MKAVLILAFIATAACVPPAPARQGRTSSMMSELDHRTAAPEAAKTSPTPRSEAPRLPGRHENREFDEVGVGRSLSHESQEAAVARAREDALSKAMIGAADVFYGFSDVSSEIGPVHHESVAKYLFTTNQGILTELSTGAPACSLKDSTTTCRLRVRGTISFRGSIDPSYLLLDQQSGKALGLDRRQYFDGEPVKISLSATKDSYIYVFSWDADDDLYLVFPSAHNKDNRLAAGSALFLPQESSGMSYRASLPAGKSAAAEKLLVIAAQRELSIPNPPESGSGAYKAGSMTSIMQSLSLLERREWTLQVIPYDISARGVRK